MEGAAAVEVGGGRVNCQMLRSTASVKVTRESPKTTTSEEKGQRPKSGTRTCIRLLTSLGPEVTTGPNPIRMLAHALHFPFHYTSEKVK